MKLRWLKLKTLCLLGIVLVTKKIGMKLLSHSLSFPHLPRELTYLVPSPYSYLLKCETSLREWVKLLNGALETNQCTPKQDVGYLEHLIRGNPELNTPELKAAITEAALLSLKLELDFINKVYEMGDLEGCNKEDLISFIKHRVNTKMGDLGYEGVVNGIDPNALKRMKWFDSLSAGKQHTDFFASRVTNYSKGNMSWDESIF